MRVPQTIGRKFNIGKIAQIQCVINDTLEDIEIKGQCFWMLIIYEGSVCFRVGDVEFEAIGPCWVCFDEREQPQIIKKQWVKCDSIYFHPIFLNRNMIFELLHSENYEDLALSHDMFLMRPFIDDKRYVFPLFNECRVSLNRLIFQLEDELVNQSDWYWSCRCRSFFIEIILLLERAYGIIVSNNSGEFINEVKNSQLRKAVLYIESHYHESITLKDISRIAAINHTTLTRLFKSELGVTAMEYLWRYRIIVAKKHLAFTSLSVNEISVLCGFKTVQHFSRKFEAYTNNTPTAFRNKVVKLRKTAF